MDPDAPPEGATHGADERRDESSALESSEYTPTDSEREPVARVIRRVRLFSFVAYFAFAIWMSIAHGWRAFVGLTCSAAVIMINFLWLEEVVENLLQPAPHLHAWRLTLRALARFALLGAALLVTIFVARFNALSVLLGFSIVVVGIMGEAVYTVYRSLTE